MAFPHMGTKSTNFTITPQMEELLDQNFTPLGKFLEGKTDAKCEVELEKIGDQHTGKIYRAEINIYTSGKVYRAETTEESMEAAIDIVRDEIRRELLKDSERQHSLMKRGGQKIKEMIQSE